MSIYGATANTELEETIRKSEEGEALGAVIYQALALLAREQGFAEEAQIFSEIANMESHHSGFYAAMNAKYPQDFWALLKNMQQAEANADSRMPQTIEKVRALGTKEAVAAAEGMELICAQERYHSEMLKQLIARHERNAAGAGQNLSNSSSEGNALKEMSVDNTTDSKEKASEVKVYVCKVCGYEHVGSLDEEPDDYVCPLCHKGKEYFVEKNYV
jgi:rubrerythrin